MQHSIRGCNVILRDDLEEIREKPNRRVYHGEHVVQYLQAVFWIPNSLIILFSSITV